MTSQRTLGNTSMILQYIHDSGQHFYDLAMTRDIINLKTETKSRKDAVGQCNVTLPVDYM